MLHIIVAKAHNNVIGKNNALLWHIGEDLRHFKQMTTNHVIIMGRRTLESLPGQLPNRTHWVLTRNKNYVPPFEGVRVFYSLPELLEAVKKEREVYCIGGAEIYKLLLPYASYLHVTEVNNDYEGDAYFPPIDGHIFEEIERRPGREQDKAKVTYDFVTYKRKESI